LLDFQSRTRHAGFFFDFRKFRFVLGFSSSCDRTLVGLINIPAFTCAFTCAFAFALLTARALFREALLLLGGLGDFGG